MPRNLIKPTFYKALFALCLHPLHAQYSTPPIISELIDYSEANQAFKALRFDTHKDFLYRIQRSDDLAHWDEYFSIDGFDEEFIFPMVATSGTHSSGSSGAQLQGVLVTLNPSLSGGTLMTWRSLANDSGLRTHLPDIDLASQWNTAPLVSYSTSNYMMLIVKSDIASALPDPLPILSPTDQAFFDSFALEFSAIANSSSSQAAAPVALGGEKFFYRITNEVSDLDSDGIPDFVESTPIEDGGTGSDPLDPDTDEDGVFDGAEVAQMADPNDANNQPNVSCVPQGNEEGADVGGGLQIPHAFVQNINFHGNYSLSSDNQVTAYTSPHWKIKSHAYPISYAKGETMKISALIKYPNANEGSTLTVEITDPDGNKLKAALNQSANNDTLFHLPATPFNAALKDEIQHYSRKTDGNEFKLSWKFVTHIDEHGNEFVAGGEDTKHTLYVTHGKPIAGDNRGGKIRQETIFDIATRYAKGMKANDQAGRLSIVKTIYAPFGNIDVRKVKPTTGTLGDQPMTYYGGGNATNTPCTTGQQMVRTNGNGECTAWADLFSDVLRVHGFKGVRMEVTPANPNEKRVLVNNVQFVGNPINNPNLGPYVWSGGINLLTHSPNNPQGIFGQGSNRLVDPPTKIFGNHYIVNFQGTLFDTSYEGNPVSPPDAIAKYENAAFAGYGITVQNPNTGKDIHFFRKNDPGNTPEIKLTTHPDDK